MKCCHPAVLVAALAMALPAVADAQQRVRAPRSSATPSTAAADRWVRQLDNEINHLQEDLHFQRGDYPRGLDERAEQASRAVAHFHHVLHDDADRQHLMRDFQEMDQQVHRLVDVLNQSGDSWLRRQASRMSYADEQLHFALRTALAEASPEPQGLLERHARVLEREAENLQELTRRLDRGDGHLRESVEAFADEAEHFRETIERGGDHEHLHEDFENVDHAWRQAVEQINQSSYGLYLRRTAQDVNRVHNQIYSLLSQGPQPPPIAPPAPPTHVERRNRPAIEFEIPGIGRFRIPQ